jgi:hypothetical protein
MHVKGIPLEIDPTGQVSLNGDSMQVYQEPFDLPCDEKNVPYASVILQQV